LEKHKYFCARLIFTTCKIIFSYYFAELQVVNQLGATPVTINMNSQSGNELEPEHSTDHVPLRNLDHFHIRHPEILDRSLAIDRDPLTARERELPLVKATVDGEISLKNNFANRQDFIHQNNNASLTIKENLKEMLSSSNIPSFSDSFRDKANENSAEIFDPNTEEVAKVVAKYMEDYDVKPNNVNPKGMCYASDCMLFIADKWP